MPTNTPYGQLAGTCLFYIAPLAAGVAEAEDLVDVTPSGNWVALGETDGDQSVQRGGSLTYFRDNDHTGPRKAVRPNEELKITATLVNLTMEQRAYVLSMAQSDITTAVTPSRKILANKRGFYPTVYSLIVKGTVDSPYGALPGQYYIPMGVFDGEPTEVRSKDGRPGLEFTFTALEDTAQSSGEEFGVLTVQTS